MSAARKRTLDLVVAPTGIQPGGYIPNAYAGRNKPLTPTLDLEIAHLPGLWRISVSWPCPEKRSEIGDDPSLFPDAAALLVPLVPDAPWITMGAPGKGVEGVLWRPDLEDLRRIRAEGLGSVERGEAAPGWSAKASWDGGRWQVLFTLRGWPALDSAEQLALAIWRGAERERGGLKSITPGWVDVGAQA
jgi:DMSO reductase family type II enzyme heme b subunit